MLGTGHSLQMLPTSLVAVRPGTNMSHVHVYTLITNSCAADIGIDSLLADLVYARLYIVCIHTLYNDTVLQNKLFRTSEKNGIWNSRPLRIFDPTI